MTSAFRRMLRGAQHLVPAARGGVTVLCYHLAGAGTGSPVDADLGAFREQVEWLAGHARIVRLEEIADRLQEPPEGPPRVCLTFDDAFRNFSERVLPILVDLAVPATLFVPVGFVEGTSPSPIRGLRLPAMSWQQLAEAVATGFVSIGSHSWSHLDLRSVSAAEMTREVVDARGRLEQRLGVPARAFCYPRALWSRAAEPHVAAVHDLAVVGGGRAVTAPSYRPLRLPRTSIRSDMALANIQHLVGARVALEEWIANAARLRPGY